MIMKQSPRYIYSSVLAGIPGAAQGNTTAQSVSHRCWQHMVRHNGIVSTGDFLVADCSLRCIRPCSAERTDPYLLS